VTPELRRELLADHARRPVGRVEPPSPGEWQQATLTTPTCGDEVTVRVRIADGTIADGTIDALEWHGIGCEVSQASASLLAAAVVTGTAASAVPELVARVERLVHDTRPAAEGAETDADPDVPGTVGDDLGDVEALAGIGRYPVRARCALLAWQALAAAVTPSAPLPPSAG
jgi:nitrogen fixation NifU-like protein